MISSLSLHHFRFHLEPKAPLHMPAYNKGSTLRLTPKGNVIRGGFGGTFTVEESFPTRREQYLICYTPPAGGARIETALLHDVADKRCYTLNPCSLYHFSAPGWSGTSRGVASVFSPSWPTPV